MISQKRWKRKSLIKRLSENDRPFYTGATRQPVGNFFAPSNIIFSCPIWQMSRIWVPRFTKPAAVAAVAATNEAIAKQAVRKIKVEYEVLDHVMNPYEAAQPDAPILHEDQFTHGVEPEPKAPSNLFRTVGGERGDLGKGFADSDLVVEREFTSEPVHQGYIEP